MKKKKKQTKVISHPILKAKYLTPLEEKSQPFFHDLKDISQEDWWRNTERRLNKF